MEKNHRKFFYTNYSLDTVELAYLDRNFPERKTQSYTNPTKAGHGLAATVRDLSEYIWHSDHSQYKILDIGGSLTRNGGANGFPTYNIVLSQKDLVRGLREEKLHADFKRDLKEYVRLEELLEGIDLDIEADKIDDWSDDEVHTQIPIIEIDDKEQLLNDKQDVQNAWLRYGSRLQNYKKIYRKRHYDQLKNKFEWLLFNHSAYDIPPQQIMEYMIHFGAKKATAFINKWSPNKPIYANSITCEMMEDVATGKTLFAQKDSEYTSFYAHEQDPRTYAVPGKCTIGKKCMSWEIRVVREDLIEVEFSLTRAFLNEGIIQEAEAIALKKEFYSVVYQDPRTGQTSKYETKYRAPPYFQNRVDTLMIREFAGKKPSKKEIFDKAQSITALENRKILLTENNKTLSVNLTKEQLLDVTIHTAVEYATYSRIAASVSKEESKIFMWCYWLLSWILTQWLMDKITLLIHWMFYAQLKYIHRTEYFNVELHKKYDTIINKEYNGQSAIGTPFDLDDDLNEWWDTFMGWATLDGFAYGKLLSNAPTRDQLIDTLKSSYLKTTGCAMHYYPVTMDILRGIKAKTVIVGDLTIDLVGISAAYAVYASKRLQKKFDESMRQHRPKNETIQIESPTSIVPEFEVIKVQKPPVQFENVTKFSIKDLKYNEDDCIEFNFGTSSTKTQTQDTQDWLKNLSVRNDLPNNDSPHLSGTAEALFCKMHRPKFNFATPHEYYQRWINTKPESETEKMLDELDEFHNSLTDASIFLKLEHLFKKFNDPQFVKAHTVTHFDKVANCILTMFIDDFKIQITQHLRKFNIVYTDGTPTFELEHLRPRKNEIYFESDLTAQDAKQGAYTVAEFIKFYDLVGAPQDLTNCLFATYTHTARNSKTGTTISNGTLKPTGGPDTGTNNLLNNLLISQDLLFSPHHKYSQILGDDLKSILTDQFDVDAFINKAQTFGTEIKPEIREYPEFCSNVTYHQGEIAKLVPKTEKVLNTIKGAELAHSRGLTDQNKLASTILNFATMYGHFEEAKTVVSILRQKGYVNHEYNQASVPLFKNDTDVSQACVALSTHSVYTDDVAYQTGLFGFVTQELLRITYEYL